jgi:hypothetical protein
VVNAISSDNGFPSSINISLRFMSIYECLLIIVRGSI